MKRKLAIIRMDSGERCPFGLPIPWACKHAGEVVNRMAPLDVIKDASEEEKQQISEANSKLLGWSILHGTSDPARCPYAQNVFPNKDAVDCNYGDMAQGQRSGEAPVGAPFYSSTFPGVGVSGLYSYPIGYYSDYDISRNLFYGVMSLHGKRDKHHDLLVKWAETIVEQRLKYANKSE